MSAASIFLNYCLTCDRQIESAGQVYCSQQCRLADLCTSPSTSGRPAMPPTPYTQQPSHHHHSTSVASTASSSSPSRQSTHFVLPPAYDFSLHRNSTVSVASSSSSASSASPSQSAQMSAPPPRPASGYFAFAGSNNLLLSSSEAAKKTLSPTSSRSSITSTGEDIRHELRMYESGFDQVRDWRRRRASVYENTWRN